MDPETDLVLSDINDIILEDMQQQNKQGRRDTSLHCHMSTPVSVTNQSSKISAPVTSLHHMSTSVSAAQQLSQINLPAIPPQQLGSATIQQPSTSSDQISSGSISISQNSTRKAFNCDKCNKGYSTKFTLSRHSKVCKGMQTHFTCDYCGQKFGQKYKSKYINHQKYCNQKTSTCETCGIHFDINQRANYIRHQEKCVSRFNCSICGVTFANEEEYGKHMEICNYVCDICGKIYTSKQYKSFRNHSQKCQNKKKKNSNKIICPVCNKCTFYNVNTYKLHYEKCKNLFCPKCARKFASYQKLKYHVDNKICEEYLYRYQCGKCLHVFKHKKNIQSHKLRCKQQRNFYVCQFCEKQFKNKAGLVSHLKYCKKLDYYEETVSSSPSSTEGSINSPCSQSEATLEQGVYLIFIPSTFFSFDINSSMMKQSIFHLIAFSFLFVSILANKCTYSNKFNSIYCLNISILPDINYKSENDYFYLIIENSTVDIEQIKSIGFMFYHITFVNANVSCSEIDPVKMRSNDCFNSAASVMGPQLPDYNLNVHSAESYVVVYITLLFAGLLNAITWIISLHLKKKKLEYERMMNQLR